MRVLVIAFLMLTATHVSADNTSGFHAGLSDCLEGVQSPNQPLRNAAEVSGTWESGFVAWYHDGVGEPVFGIKLGRGQDGSETVYSCTAPAAMGPFVDDYLKADQAMVRELAHHHGLTTLHVPLEGDYFANCNAPAPNLLVAVQFDDTRRTGFRVLSSNTVADSCARFGDKD